MNIAIKVILISFICLNMWVNIMVLALKPGTKIVAKTGNPAGLLFRRIWYSVGKSGVLGITEYRQGRPLNTTSLHCIGQGYTSIPGIQVITATVRNGDNKNGDTPKRRQQKRRQLWSKRRQCISQNGDNY